MAYNRPADLDGFIALMGKADMRVRAQLAEDLVNFLSDSENELICSDLGMLIDGLQPWLTGSHFKIAQRALEALSELIGRLGQDFNAYTPTVLQNVVDRLGDNRDTVREKAQLVLQKLVEYRVLTPQQLLDKLTTCFKHKNSKVREEFLKTIVNTLNEYGTQSLSLKNYIQPIADLLGDPTVTVRDEAVQTLVEIYKHVGDKLRADLQRKDVPIGKLAILEGKFDEIRNDGLLMPSALTSHALTNSDDIDTAAMPRPTRLVKRVPSAPPRRPAGMEACGMSSGDLAAGAVSQDVFEACFEAVPAVVIYGTRDFEEKMKQIIKLIGDKTMDWEKRVDALKNIRSLLMSGPQQMTMFLQYLKDLSIAFLDILKELRSQVIREACITLAYMSKTLKNKLDQFSIYILQELVNLIQNSAKVISSAGTIALKFVIRYTHAPKLIPILTQNLMQSKSKDIRSTLCEVMLLLYEEWATRSLERSATQLRDALKKGLSDADVDARRYSRRAYWSFHRHFPAMASELYQQLDITTQRAVDRERDDGGGNGTGSMSASLRGSNSSLNSMPGSVLRRKPSSGLRSPVASPSEATSTSTENLATARLQRVPSLPRSYNRNRSGIPVAHREMVPCRANFRSISAVDTQAAQRARARAQYSSLARLKVSSGTASLPRAKKSAVSTPSQQPSPEHRGVTSGRQTSRSGVSQSQPTSRSTSPSSRLKEPYATYATYRQTGTVPKKASGIPRSLANSRETSPTRTQSSAVKRNVYGSNPRRPPINPGRPLMAQKILQQSREQENALADALSPEDDLSADFSRLKMKSSRDESDESEASSVCSDRSFGNFRRGGDTYSWSGSRSRLDGYRSALEDIDDIIQYCASTQWTERRDGLVSLTQYLAEGKVLNQQQLQCMLDLFRKMFMDTQTKVYALFLDALNEVILAHANDLHDWLFILLTRLFLKLGTDLLGSMQTKIWKTLDLVYEYFPGDLQIQSVFRILVDSAQTQNTKSRVATLKFLTNLAQTYCQPEHFSIQRPAEAAVIKIVQASQDKKSMELRNQARHCLFALYKCNPQNMTSLLQVLPKEHSDGVKVIIQQNLRKGTDSPSSPLSCTSPKPQLSPSGPYSLQNNSSPRSRQSSVETSDPMNSEEVYKSLKKTTAEIQNYSFESKLDRDANSKDSGISQMGGGDHVTAVQMTEQYLQTRTASPGTLGLTQGATNGLNGHFSLGEKDDSCNGSKTQSATTTESNTPENTVRIDTTDCHDRSITKADITFDENGEIIIEKTLRESDIVKAAVLLNMDTPQTTVAQILSNLSACITYGNCQLPILHFKGIMKMLLNLLQSSNVIVLKSAIRALCKVVRSESMKPCWIQFLELILLKIIDSYRTNRDVVSLIENSIPKIAAVLPLDLSINILNPVIATGEFPTNLCAVKILTELASKQGKNLTEHHLDVLMPNIALLTDDSQSMVRKAAVFCIVKLYIVMGEEKVKPKFSMLTGSKVRLLNVYINKFKSSQEKTSS
ncbi:CLIP-associating protein isoform X2 [Phlebotomus argentipes]|uniref:CLIP-associating protein isoform X2 n=1 Tax=Phlebotomus argentipes TaxID=94469 RepID=UPI0028936CC7|nr:CLIP-associating protein isoform X2 [Phlebotomus argentipes]